MDNTCYFPHVKGRGGGNYLDTFLCTYAETFQQSPEVTYDKVFAINTATIQPSIPFFFSPHTHQTAYTPYGAIYITT